MKMGRRGRHRSATRAQVWRRREIPLVDIRTGQAHYLTGEALAAGRKAKSRYIALCGADVLPADAEAGWMNDLSSEPVESVDDSEA